jgi:hypothetical protein
MARPPPAPPPPSPPPPPLLAQTIAAKVANLRLLRALDRAGVLPNAYPGLPAALAALTQHDVLLTALADFAQREAGVSEEGGLDLHQFVAVAEEVRSGVLSALPPVVARRVTRALEEVAAGEAEICIEIDEHRRRSMAAVDAPRSDEVDLSAAMEADRDVMRRAYAAGVPLPLEEDPRVTRLDARALPRSEEAGAWLDRLPAGWLRVAARLHGVPSEGGKARLVEALARHLHDADAVREVLRRNLGRPELEVLAFILAHGGLPADLLGDHALAVPWDWSEMLPATTAGHLRAHALLFVGTSRGQRLVAVPESLHTPLATALLPLLREADDPGPFVEAIEALASGQPFLLDIEFDDP